LTAKTLFSWDLANKVWVPVQVDATGKLIIDSIPAHAPTHAAGGGDDVTLTEAQVTGLVADLAAKLNIADIDDTPVNGIITRPISSNWAYDHNARDATAAVQGHATAAQITKLDGIEALADVTDAGNVAAAGAVMSATFNDHSARHEYQGADAVDIRKLFYSIGGDINHRNWDNLDGWTAGATGSGTAPVAGPLLNYLTGATNGSKSYLYWPAAWVGQVADLSVMIYTGINPTNNNIFIGWYTNPTAPTAIEIHVGWRITNGRIYASYGNGAAETTIDSGVTLAINVTHKLYMYRVNPNTSYFFVDNVLLGTIVGAVNSNIALTYFITNVAAENHDFHHWAIVWMCG